jgi:uncharacterized protein YcbK (DUF882 family)
MLIFNPRWGRRTFLKASLLTVLAVSGGQLAWARDLLEDGLPPGKISLYNTHTSESLEVTYRDRTGEYDLEALQEISWLLRCHHTDEVCEIDVQTIEFLSMVDQRLGGNHAFHVISGYRSPTYNERLRQQGRKVAKRSLHLEGKAIDIRIPGVKLSNLRRVALGLEYGGVGYYPKADFVHLDSGTFRTW